MHGENLKFTNRSLIHNFVMQQIIFLKRNICFAPDYTGLYIFHSFLAIFDRYCPFCNKHFYVLSVKALGKFRSHEQYLGADI
jgi:hypothetical protein